MSTPVEQIKEKLSIVDVVSSYVKLERSGIYFKAKCPFHNERTPSFMISPARNTYHCFGCAKGGDIFSFVQDIEGLDFPATLRLLAERAGVVLDARAKRDGGEKAMLYDVLEATTKFYEGELRRSPTAIEYLKSRGILGETAKTFRIGFAPDGWENLVHFLRTKGWQPNLIEKAGLSIPGKSTHSSSAYDRFRNRIMFPISSTQGKVIAFTGRVLPGGDDKMGKYVNSPETVMYHKSSVLYGLDLAKSAILKEGKVIVVEGQMDCIMIHQAGNQNVVAVSGTALTEEHLQLLKRFTDHIVFCFDNDNAGQAALRKAAMLSFELGLEAKAITLTGKDPADMIKENPETWQTALTNAESVIDYLMQLARKTADSPREQIRNVTEQVLPLVAALPGNMEQSYYVKRVSEIFDIPESAVRDDLKKILSKAGTTTEKTEAPPLTTVRSAKVQAAERIVGFEKVFHDKVSFDEVRTGFLEAMKVPLESFAASLPAEKIPALILEAELYYNGSEILDKIAKELVDTLLIAHYEELLAEVLRKMRQAEERKEGSEALTLHSESKQLGDIIYKIKNNRQTTEL
jgi:DNA primase